MHLTPIRADITHEPTGRIGFSYSWKGVASGVVEHSPGIENKTALDCLQDIYETSQCYVDGKGWQI